MPEGIELPRRGRRTAEHVALVADAVDRVPDRRFGAGQVRVRLVVGATHELEPTVGQERADVVAILGIGVPVRLQVVQLGQDELVVGVAPGDLEMGPDERETGLLERRPVLDGRAPRLGVGRLRVPPDRVVVEVGDQVHPPAGLLDGELERQALRARTVLDHDDAIDKLARSRRRIDHDPDLETRFLAVSERSEDHRLAGSNLPSLDADARRLAGCRRGATHDDPDDLAWRRLGADEQVGRFDRDDLHRLAPGCRAGAGAGADPSLDGITPGMSRVVAEDAARLVDREQGVEVAGAGAQLDRREAFGEELSCSGDP